MSNVLSDKLYGVVKFLRGQTRITEANSADMLREIRIALLEADVGLATIKEFIGRLKEAAEGEAVVGSLTPGQALVGVVLRELIRALGGDEPAEKRQLSLRTKPPAVLLLAGLQGAGKTTTAGKLAYYLINQKKKVLLVSVDVYRPAAMEQLRILAETVQAAFFSTAGHPPLEIATRALAYARDEDFDVVIVDSAGRTSIDKAMMDEIADLSNFLNPVETLFVLDAMIGQEAAKTAAAFHQVLNLTGLIVTKTDSDGRGGAVLSAHAITAVPVKFIGVSEKMNGLRPFDPERFARQILGMGDILALVEESQQHFDQEQTVRLARKIKKGKGFDLNDFRAQLKQTEGMGGLQHLVEKLPRHLQGKKQFSQTELRRAEKNFVRMRGIIDSMTPYERVNPDVLKASRKRRVASGSGATTFEVNQLLKQFDATQQMMKRMGSGGMVKMFSGMLSKTGPHR